MKRAAITAAIIWALTCGPASAGTIVNFKISGNSFDVELFDDITPSTVANFLQYVNEGRYDNTVIHRSIPGFVWQGGGFQLAGDPAEAVPIATYAPIENEPYLSNVRGTIAMAKVDGDPNSATSQWFFNLADNSANLDFQNGGFTVFGRVIGDGMDVVDAVAMLPTYDFSEWLGPNGGGFTNTPYYIDEARINLLVVQDIAVVPEPSTWALAAIGALIATLRSRRSRVAFRLPNTRWRWSPHRAA